MSLGQIDHIVVLMLENRSFDSMLGKLYPKSATFDGLDGTEQNPDSSGVPVQVWSSTGTDESTMRIPDPDPGELWTDINTQLFEMPNVGSPAPIPTMDGFVKNYVNQPANGGQTFDPKNVMHFFTPKRAGNQPAGQAVCGVRPLVRFRSVSDVAEPLVCPCRNRRRPRKQQADTSTRC